MPAKPFDDSSWLPPGGCGRHRRPGLVTVVNRDGPRRILHVTQAVDGGVSTVVGDQMRCQSDRGYEVHLASPDGPLRQRTGGLAIWHEWRAGRNPGWRVLTETLHLSGIVRAVDPEIVHLHSAKAGLCGRLVLRGRRVTLYQPHGWSFLAVEGLTQALARMWERLSAKWTHAVVCVSDTEEEVGLLAGVTDSRYTQHTNAVDLSGFPRVTRAAARQALGLPQAGLIVLCVARLAPQKGVDQLLAAWARIRDQFPDVRLEVVGDGEDRPLLEAQASPHPEICFRGLRSDVALWYAASDLVVLPSRYEGMAMVPLEAMAMGLSVVGFEVGGFAQSLGPVESPSPVQPAGDIDALAHAIAVRLADDRLREEEGRRNLTRDKTHHGLHLAAERMAGLYEELLQQSDVEASVR